MSIFSINPDQRQLDFPDLAGIYRLFKSFEKEDLDGHGSASEEPRACRHEMLSHQTMQRI